MDHAAVIEILDRDGQVRAVHKVLAWPLRIGRSPVCDVVLNDPHLAGEHAELSWGEAGAELLMLDSLNGGWQGQRRLRAGDRLPLAGLAPLQLGATRLRLRSSRDVLAPERPLARPASARSRWRHLWAPGLALSWALLLWYDQWAGMDPGAPWVDYASAVLGPLGVVTAWAALWALITQLFQHWFAFAPHFKRVLAGALGLHLLGILLPALAYAFSAPRLMALDSLLFPLGLAGVLWWQASVVWPRARRWVALGLGAALALGFTLMVGKRIEQQYWLGPPYLAALPPPALRLVEPKTPEALIDELRPLQAQLARQASKDNDLPSADQGNE